VQKTQWNHATHAAGVLPAHEERKKSDKVQILLFAAWELITQEIPGKKEKISR
jgi:hypothetical protein